MEFAIGLAGLLIGALVGLLIGRSKGAAALALAEDRFKQLDLTRMQLEAAQAATGRLTGELAAERTHAAEKLKLVEEAKQALADSFRALSADALTINNTAFLQLAQETLAKFQEAAQGDLEKRSQAIGEVVKPVGEALGKLDVFIREVETKREGAYQGLREQNALMLEAYTEMKGEAGKLASALRSPTVRGRWGEIQLRRVVELAGMVPYCDFEEQLTVDGPEGRLRPDMVVRLPGDKAIVVDAKAPLDAYLEAIDAADPEQRRVRMLKYAQRIRDHMKTLGSKAYASQFASPEFTVLFLPGDHFYAAALEYDPTLIEQGFATGVLIATPTSLVGLLQTAAHGWRQEQIADNARRIAALGRDLYDRLRVFAKNFSGVARGLRAATESYNDAVGSLESRVLVAARRFEDLGATSANDPIPEAKQLDLAVREPRRLEAPAALIRE